MGNEFLDDQTLEKIGQYEKAHNIESSKIEQNEKCKTDKVDEIGDMIRACILDDHRNGFVLSLKGWYDTKGFLTPKQKVALERIYGNIDNPEDYSMEDL